MPESHPILTPDQRLRVFVSSTLQELAEERKAVRRAIERLRLAPVMFELGARPHPPRDLYRAYLDQSHIFLGIYWQSYGWVAPEESVSGLEDEYNLSGERPKLIYVKSPAPDRQPRLKELLDRIKGDDGVSYKSFTTARELGRLVEGDLVILLTERFGAIKSTSAKPATTAPGDSLPTGTVTFLFTDIEGSTKLWQSQPTRMQAALARHDEILRSAIEFHGGQVFKTVGDAFYAVFQTAPHALEAAVRAQRLLYEETWEPECPIRVRMALHTGSAEERGGDYFGNTPNRLARILSAGHGGQVLLSAPTQELVRDVLPEGVGLLEIGEHRLKDLTRPERVFQIAIHGLPSEFPPLKSLDNRPNNLPLQPTPFVGREREVETVGKLLDRSDVRLLTLTGAGGTGKTRLALQAAADRIEEYEDGVYFIDLASLTDHSLVPSAVAHELGVAELPGQPIQDTLKAHLADKEMLLLLDNFEQVLPAAALVPRLLASSPELKVMATSRAPLRVRGEQEYPVPTLSVPDIRRLPSLEALSEYDSVRLFVERARSVKPDFEVTSENGAAIAEICYRLDGLPLAIELAAARTRLFPPQSLLSRLASRLKVLTGGARDLPARQQTLRGAIDWSYHLLGEEDKALFARLSVFVGGRSFEAIEAVCNPEGDLDIISGVESLLEKSLLRQEEGAGGEPRFVMLETIHEYAMEKLEECGQADATRRAHAGHFLSLAEDAEWQLVGPRQVEWLERLEEEYDNLRAALWWALGGGDRESGLRLAAALGFFYIFHNHTREGRRWLEEALSGAGKLPGSLRAKGLAQVGHLAYALRDHDAAVPALEESVALYRELGDGRDLAYSLLRLGLAVAGRGDSTRADQLLEESLSVSRQLGDTLMVASSLMIKGGSLLDRGDYAAAVPALEHAAALHREMGNMTGVGVSLTGLGWAEVEQGGYDRAAEVLRESLALSRDLGTVGDLADSLEGLAAVAGSVGSAARAARLFGAAQALREAARPPLPPSTRPMYGRHLAAARSQLDEPAWETAWEEGQAMEVKQAVEYALGDATEPTPSAASPVF